MVVKKHRKRKKIIKPFCWYCERRFESERILVMHQKAKHFKCSRCRKKLGCASALVVHMFQMHQDRLSRVPNSKPNRDSVNLEIYGMEGVPVEDIIDFNLRLNEINKAKAIAQKAKRKENTLGSVNSTGLDPSTGQVSALSVYIVYSESVLSQEEMRSKLPCYQTQLNGPAS